MTYRPNAAARAGRPATADLGTASANTLGAGNRVHWARVTGAGTISKIGLQVTASAGNIAVAVYRNSGAGRSAVPGSRVATSGSVACPATGYQEVSLGGSVEVEDGDWFAVGSDSASFGCAFSTGASSFYGISTAVSALVDGAYPPAATAPSMGTGWGQKTPVLIGIA